MRERLYYHDRDGNLVVDPRRSEQLVEGLWWETMWPVGFGACGHSMPGDIFETLRIKQAHKLIVRDGQRIVYQGEVNSIGRNLTGRVPVEALAEWV